MSPSYHSGKFDFCSFPSLTTLEFKWLLAEAWGEQQWSYWAAERSKLFTPQFCHPDILAAKSSKNKLLSARWLWLDNQGQNLGWAEAQAFAGTYQLVYLACGLSATGLQQDPRLITKALSFLISGIFLALRADLVKVSSLQPGLAPLLAGLNPQLRPRLVWSPVKDLTAAWSAGLSEAGVFAQLWELDAQSWWQLERVQDERKALRYLELRRENQETLAAARCRRPARVSFLTGLQRLLGRRK